VKDTGIGIRKEHHEAIFQRFHKIEEDKDRVYRGAGLGLSISQQLAHLLKGKLWVESVPEEGSVFYLIIPANQSGFKEFSNKPDHVQHTIPKLENKIILVAEDDEANFLFIQKLIRKTRAGILHAATGEQAVEMAEKNPGIDLVLMDIKMPGINGKEAMEKIRVKLPGIPVIAQTAYAMADDMRRLQEAGFRDYIAKPIQPGHLYALLCKYLRV
jgi:CheY-like chemotaxis protein